MRAYIIGLITILSLSLVGCQKCEEPEAANKAIDVPKQLKIVDSGKTPKGTFPLIHIWRDPSPRKRACSVKPNTPAEHLGHRKVKDDHWIKVKTEKCSGWIRSKHVRPQNSNNP